MLDRDVVREFLEYQLENIDLAVPGDIDLGSLVEAFCQYTENDYYEWLKDNFKSFFDHGDVDWGGVREKIRSYGNQGAT